MTNVLFKPYELNNTLTLSNRILMAPLTRCMADEELVPIQAMADYYARRADAGLIISEAIVIRPDGQGYPNTPGLFTPQQIEGWRKVTDAVHKKGGKMFAQLWHTGRLAHTHFFEGDATLAPSAIAFKGTVPQMRELTYQIPKAVTDEDITQLIQDYSQAASNAIEAGFDGVEIHAANGYLIDQFLHYDTNRRTDEYGETAVNMSRFALAVVDAVTTGIGNECTAIRVSPGAYVHVTGNSKDREVFDHLLPELEKRKLAYVHIGIFDDSIEFDYLGGTVSSYVRSVYRNTLVGNGGYTAETGATALAGNNFDLLSIGKSFIANPDYVAKIYSGEDLLPYNEDMLGSLV